MLVDDEAEDSSGLLHPVPGRDSARDEAVELDWLV
jgi:hypothetical protein